MRFRIALLAALGASLALGGTALADVTGLVGNTVMVTMGDGSTVKVMLKSDGTYQAAPSNGPAASGTWAEQGDQVCYTQTDPAPAQGAPNPFCAGGMSGHKVGDSWSVSGQGGNVNLSVVAGQ